MSSLSAQALFLAAVFVIFYFVLIRPQQLRLKRHREMLDGLRPGLRVATTGGLVGRIVSVEHPDLLTLEISDGVTVEIVRKSVDMLAEPAALDKAAAEALTRQTAGA